jgi:hypothetical protein
MHSEAVELRAQAKKCRDLARAAIVPSSKDLLLKTAREFDAAADRIELHGNLGFTRISSDGMRSCK